MRYEYQKLKEFGTRVMVSAGLEEEEASIFMENLLFADSRGVGSHGISRLINYAKRVKCGIITAGANAEIVQESAATLVIDGHNGIGAKIARQAMDLSIAKAKEAGCCVTTVRGGNHYGAGAFYSKYAAEQGMIAWVLSVSSVAVAPTGGAKAMLGTNPFSLAVPAERNDPFDLDMATSVVARGKVVLNQKNGKSVPEGWGLDKHGVSTTDPNEILDDGFMLPFGDYKGYGISLFIDLMCGCLAGATNSRTTPSFWNDYENPQNLGYFMMVIDPEKFMPLAMFKERVDDMLEEFKNCPTAPGVDRVRIPGEIEADKERESKEQGVEISDAVAAELKKVGEMYGVPVNF